MTRPIGGFLPLRLGVREAPEHSLFSFWVGEAGRPWLFHNARSALHTLWLRTKPKRVWLPAYVCNEVAAAVPADIEVHYYGVDEALAPRVDDLAAKIVAGDHVLTVDYFGRPQGPALRSLAERHPEVGWIEDRAQALDPGVPAFGDWMLYSPRKLVGVADGGLLVSHRKPLPEVETVPLHDFAFVLPALERCEDVDESRNDNWYARYMQAEQSMQVSMEAMSRMTRELLQATPVKSDSDARRANYASLQTRLQDWALFPEAESSFVPLGFPLRVPSAPALAQALQAQRIFAARHWAALPSQKMNFPLEHQLAWQLITLPCDYRYDADDMRRIADAVIAHLKQR